MKKSAKHSRNTAKILLPLLTFVLVSAVSFSACLIVSVKTTLNAKCGPLDDTQTLYLEQTLASLYPERSRKSISPLPYTLNTPQLDITAKSAIIVDTSTGSILYQKNAEELIPPASLTKIVEMYVVLSHVEDGQVSLNDTVPLPPESWSENLPSDASRMYLSRGQSVTLKELLLGLAIASGNDASIAVANFLAPSMKDFVDEMNSTVKSMGLTKTHFVESSGYSEKNITNAHEFAQFAMNYINRFPYSLEYFHSQKQLVYPEEHNLSREQIRAGGIEPIVQQNTNKLLESLEGCDGLKTGFINESGYNIAVTAERYGTRFLSVTMGGPGSNTAEGNKHRVNDNMTLFNWAFNHFADYHPPKNSSHEFDMPVLGCREKAVKLVPALDETFTVPYITSDSPTGCAASVHAYADVPDFFYGEVECGKAYGTITYQIDGKVLRSMPLVADRSSSPAMPLKKLYDKAVYIAIQKCLKIRNQ